MKIWKKSMLILGAVVLLIISSMSVSAESDPTGDVYHQIVTDSTFSYELFGERDNIDITDISYSVSGTDVIVSISVKGSITNNQNIFYYGYLKKDDTSFYTFSYSQGTGMVAGTGDYAGFYDLAPTYSTSSDGKTVSYTFTGLDTSIVYEPWGYSIEYVNYIGTIESEAWLDYAPGTYSPWYTAGDDETGDDDTADDDTKDDDADDTELEGIWTGTEPSTGGDWTWTFSGNTMEIIGPTEEYSGTFQIDTSQDPKHLDLFLDTGFTSLCLYQLSEGSLTVSVNSPGNPERPTSLNLEGTNRVFQLTADGTIILPNGDDTSDTSDDKGIPGFETITIISAIGIALILLRRKK